jgi:hypothetical protein
MPQRNTYFGFTFQLHIDNNMRYITKTYTHANPVQKLLMDSVWNTSGIHMEEIWTKKLMESDNSFHKYHTYFTASENSIWNKVAHKHIFHMNAGSL